MGRRADPRQGADADPVQARHDRQRARQVQLRHLRADRRDHARDPLLRGGRAAPSLWRADPGVHRKAADAGRHQFPDRSRCGLRGGRAGVSDEAAFIAALWKIVSHPGARGLLDDAAVIAPPVGREIVITHDMIAEGIHFLPGDPPGDVAWKLLAVNLSDLAAKGARPIGAILGYALAEDPGWDAPATISRSPCSAATRSRSSPAIAAHSGSRPWARPPRPSRIGAARKR